MPDERRRPSRRRATTRVAARLARDIPGAFKPDQYWNPENPAAHERTTGPELWEQTEGRITHFVASVGTGGTISGRRPVLKAQNPAIQVIGADPEGSVLSGDIARPYLTEGVGEDFLPGTYDPAVVDRWVRVSDRDAFAMARRLTREEGILSGGSCGTAMVAAREVVARPDRDRRRRTRRSSSSCCPDSGRNYLSKLYNDEWMRANGLLATTGRGRPDRGPARATGTTPDRCRRSSSRGRRSASGTRSRRSRSTASASSRSRRRPTATTSSGSSGRSARKGLLDRAFRDPLVVERTVGEVMDPPLPLVEASATLDEAFALLMPGRSALVAVRGERPPGVVTKLDLLEYLAHRPGAAG